MAHIRQILANLSISVSEFKKNPKTVIKAVKSEPIAVIINNKPAFYCVPADILESLYSKFYEMNEIQNIQEFNNDSDGPVCNVDDDSFGVRDIFQTIEDEQAAKLSNSDDLVDPIKNSVADPLDEEVANKLNCSIDAHILDKNNKVVSLNAPNSMGLSFDDLEDGASLNSFDGFSPIDPICPTNFNDNLLCEFDSDNKLNNDINDDLNYVSSLSDLDPLRSPVIKSSDESQSEATLAHAEKVVKQEQEKAKESQQCVANKEDSTNSLSTNHKTPNNSASAKSTNCKLTKDSKKTIVDAQEKLTTSAPKELNITKGVDHKIDTKDEKATDDQTNNTHNSKAKIDDNKQNPINTDIKNGTVCEDLSSVNSGNNQGMRNLVSGPHSFSLEHVAKTYSPYKQKKLLQKRQQELKKEQKAEQKAKEKELKKIEKTAKYLKVDTKSVEAAEKKKEKSAKEKSTNKSKKSKLAKLDSNETTLA